MANSKYEKLIALATTVCIILLGIALIVCTAHLYFTGGAQPYSRERVGGYLVILAAPLIITAGLAVAGVLMRIMQKKEADGLTARTNSELLESFRSRFDLSSMEGFEAELIRKERNNRRLFDIIAYVTSALIFTFVLVYLGFIAEFTIDNLNGDVLSAFALALPLCAIAIGVHIPRIYFAEKSCKRELEAIKRYVKENVVPRAEKYENPKKKPDYALIARYVIIAASIVFIILGITNGGMNDVLAKAVKICTECIGLG